MTQGGWTVRLSHTAAADYDEILRWTARRFGAAQAVAYGGKVAAALARLARGPAVPGARAREEIGAGVRSLHVGARSRHVVLFRVGSEAARTLEVLRILHDAMDLARHVPEEG